MSTHPYIPLYVDDYDAHTSHLTAAEDGVYGRLLRLCWRSPGCCLPDDHAWIARKIRLSADEFEAVAKPVLDEFFRLQRGRLVQKRLKAEYDDISRKKTARQQAGKKGGTAKAQKTKENPPSIATVLLPDTGAFPEPYPEPEPVEKREAIASPDVSAGSSLVLSDYPPKAFDRWYSGYPHKVGKDEARKAFDRAQRDRRATFGELTDGLARYIRDKPPDRSWCNPATWLNQGRWNDEPAPLLTVIQGHERPNQSPALQRSEDRARRIVAGAESAARVGGSIFRD